MLMNMDPFIYFLYKKWKITLRKNQWKMINGKKKEKWENDHSSWKLTLRNKFKWGKKNKKKFKTNGKWTMEKKMKNEKMTFTHGN